MKYSFCTPQLPDTVFDVKISFWTGKKAVLVNGEPAKEDEFSQRRKPRFIIPYPDGTKKILEIKPPRFFFDGGLIVVLDGQNIQVSRPLKGYEYVMSGLPILLIFAGGALGALVGSIGACINFRIVRTKMNIAVKILATLGISAVSALIYFCFAVLVHSLLD